MSVSSWVKLAEPAGPAGLFERAASVHCHWPFTDTKGPNVNAQHTPTFGQVIRYPCQGYVITCNTVYAYNNFKLVSKSKNN